MKESQLSASSQSQTVYNRASHGPYRAGLHGAKYWAPAGGLPSYDRTQYVQVEFRELKRIEMVRKRCKKSENKRTNAFFFYIRLHFRALSSLGVSNGPLKFSVLAKLGLCSICSQNLDSARLFVLEKIFTIARMLGFLVKMFSIVRNFVNRVL